MIDENYVDDRLLLTNTPTQAESLLNSPEQAAGGTGLYINANKTLFTCFKQKGVISSQSG